MIFQMPIDRDKIHFGLTILLTKIFLACDLFSLRCGVLNAEIILNSTCFDTKSYMLNTNPNEIYVHVNSSSSLGI